MSGLAYHYWPPSDFANTNLSGAILPDRIDTFNFTRANLEGVQFGTRYISECRFDHANLTDADLSQVQGAEKATFVGANLTRTRLPPGLNLP